MTEVRAITFKPGTQREIRDELLGQPIGEILVRGVGADIGERENCETILVDGTRLINPLSPAIARPGEQHPIDIHREFDPLHRFGLKLLKLVGDLGSDLIVDGARNANSPRLGEGLDSGCDVHCISQDVGPVLDHIPQMDSDPNSNGRLTAFRIPLVYASLDVDCALNGLERAVELHEEAVPRRFDFTPLVKCEKLPKQIRLLAERLKGSTFVSLCRRCEPNGVGKHDRGETAALFHEWRKHAAL